MEYSVGNSNGIRIPSEFRRIFPSENSKKIKNFEISLHSTWGENFLNFLFSDGIFRRIRNFFKKIVFQVFRRSSQCWPQFWRTFRRISIGNQTDRSDSVGKPATSVYVFRFSASLSDGLFFSRHFPSLKTKVFKSKY